LSNAQFQGPSDPYALLKASLQCCRLRKKLSLTAQICQDADCHVILVDKKKRATYHSKVVEIQLGAPVLARKSLSISVKNLGPDEKLPLHATSEIVAADLAITPNSEADPVITPTSEAEFEFTPSAKGGKAASE
jgi:hypothetical protein